ncbi:hypothetical protein Sjap_012416 [Stephania japonica]|uniref:Uncharacterized protein n=1 Tax=Stephania japonica TaxID=461633 RepID=A0AAP0NY83_9MAGN
MVFHLGYDYTLEHGLVCDGGRVDRSRMYLQLSRGIKGTLSTKKLGKEYAGFELRCRSLLFIAPWEYDSCCQGHIHMSRRLSMFS